MLFKNTLIGAIATFAVVSLAAAIPGEGVDGLYTQSLNDDGTLGEVVLLQSLSARTENPSPVLTSRAFPNPQIGCSGYAMDKSAYGNAYNSLNDWCNKGNVVSPNSAIWWSEGSSIAYSNLLFPTFSINGADLEPQFAIMEETTRAAATSFAMLIF
jgi:hypothetical protein